MPELRLLHHHRLPIQAMYELTAHFYSAVFSCCIAYVYGTRALARMRMRTGARIPQGVLGPMGHRMIGACILESIQTRLIITESFECHAA